jgi:glycosyltransferase involved in cell wall biosynthesis
VIPRFSIIIPVRRAEHTIAATLQSALEQCAGAPAEVIAVVAKSDPSHAALAAVQHPALTVLAVEGKQGVPQLRRIGVLASSAPFVILAEDHCTFPAGWGEGLVRAIEERHVEVSGGAVANGRRSLAGWAQYFSRYSAFLPPVKDGFATALPGNNACYRREVIESHRDLIGQGFWEAEFNDAIRRAGCRFWISGSATVVQRQHRGALSYAPLRFRHGRCYGARRVAEAETAERKRLLFRSPLIAPLLFYRALRNVLRKPGYAWRFLAVSPLVLIYVAAWAAGEITGYLAGGGDSCLETD